jgi:amino acid adenylation domain-containing protein
MPNGSTPSSEERVAPLSSYQEQLWFLDSLRPENSAFNISIALRLKGRLDIEALRSSLDSIVCRHEVLRTVFPAQDGRPYQRVGPAAPGLLRIVEVGSTSAEYEEELRRLVDEEARRPFNLSTGPLFRALLLAASPMEHILVVTIHHIIFDGASRNTLFAELESLYESHIRGEAPQLLPVSTQYAEYAVHQRMQPVDQGLRYWTSKLKSAPQRLQLATDRPRSAERTYNRRSVRFNVNEKLYKQTVLFSRENEVTPFTTLLTSFHVLMARYAGQNDVVVGVPTVVKPDSSTEALIGLYVNTLPIRMRLHDQSTFSAVLEQVGGELWESLEHLDIPFDEIVKAVRPDRDASYNPLAQVAFGMLTDKEAGRLDLSGLQVEPYPTPPTTSTFDLSVELMEEGGRLTGTVEYNADLFDEASMTRLVDHWQGLLREAINKPHRPLFSLPLLTEEERRQVIVDWNRTDANFTAPHSLNALFEASVARTPDAVAVVSGEQRITYAELDRRVNKLAHALRKRGVSPERSVGICLERSIDSVVSMLAVLKAGGAFVALDAELPAERLAFMLKDSEAALLVSKAGIADTLPAGTDRLLLDTDRDEIDSCSSHAPVHTAVPDNLACLIYTSGSTGVPKCAMLSHRNFANYYHYFNERYRLHDVIRAHLQMSNFAFDLFIADTMRALFSGGALILCPRDIVLSPPDLYDLMVTEGVNSAEFIPSVLKILLDYLEESGGTLEFMDLLMAGGDNWYVRDYVRAKRLCAPTTRLIGTYGLTEAAIDNSNFESGDLFSDHAGVVPIGRPLANTQLYILDAGLEPVPVGVPGELYIGGAGVGRGYFGRPGLTAERYIPDPFSSHAGARMYKTGDLTRFRHDGTIEILGRVDNQVKLRGFRIELGEIETILRKHPLVENAVVIAADQGGGERRLVAYVTQDRDARATSDLPNELAGHLRQHLPGFMVPTAIVVLDRMPLNQNAKIDRSALPAPSADQLLPTEDQADAQTPIQEIIRGIWCEVLGVKRIGIHTDFFDAGGHSLLLARVVSRIRQHLGVELPLRTVYQHSTVAELAWQVLGLQGRGSQKRSDITPVERAEGGLYATSFAQQQMWLQDRIDPRNAYTVPTALRLRGDLDVDALKWSLNTLVGRHEVLRTVFVSHDGQPMQKVLAPYEVDVHFRDLSSHGPYERRGVLEERLREEDLRPFDLRYGPLFRASLSRMAPQDHVLVLTVHHVATDAWSTSILLDELSALYVARKNGNAAALPDLSLQYIDFAAWQRKWLRKDVLKDDLEYWHLQLTSAPPLIDLPLDRPRSSAQSYAGGSVRAVVPSALLQQLRDLSNGEGVTLFMTLLAAFQALLAACTKQEDVVVGAPSANRTVVESEHMLGYFVNMLPMRTNLSGGPTFRELLGRVRGTALDAYAHQDVPFEWMVEELRPKRDTQYNPVFQVVLALQNTPAEELKLPGLTGEDFAVEPTTSQFDLSLLATETSDALECIFAYRKALFDEGTVERIAWLWQRLLHEASAEPDLPLALLPVLNDPETAGWIANRAAARASWLKIGEESPSSEHSAGTGAPTALAEVLSAVWAEVLEIPEVDAQDNFFDMGGYSLLAMQMTSRIAELLEIDVSMRLLFDSPSLGDFIDQVERSLSPEELDRVARMVESAEEAPLGQTTES